MQEIVPYRSATDALEAMDNGGRFFNIFTEANDGEITSAELSKVAGAFLDNQRMFLYFDMALAGLPQDEIESVVAALEVDLRHAYSIWRPRCYTVQEARELGEPADAAIVTGIPRHVDSKTEFSYFIMIPIQTGNTSTMMMIPMMDTYDVYEVRDDESDTDFLVAHGRGSKPLPQVRMRLAGVIKELQRKDESCSRHRSFLETLFYTCV